MSTDNHKTIVSSNHFHDEIVDHDVIRNLQILFEDNYENMITIYVDTVQKLLRDIDQAIKTNSPENLYLASHDLRTYSAHLGIAKLSTIAAKLENLGKHACSKKAARLHEYASDTFNVVEQYLKESL